MEEHQGCNYCRDRALLIFPAGPSLLHDFPTASEAPCSQLQGSTTQTRASTAKINMDVWKSLVPERKQKGKMDGNQQQTTLKRTTTNQRIKKVTVGKISDGIKTDEEVVVTKSFAKTQ